MEISLPRFHIIQLADALETLISMSYEGTSINFYKCYDFQIYSVYNLQISLSNSSFYP